MQNAGRDEAQVGIKTAGRNINNLRYADDTTLTAESEEALRSLLMKLKEEGAKAGFKCNLQKSKIMAPVTSFHANSGRNNGNSNRLYFFGFQYHCRW